MSAAAESREGPDPLVEKVWREIQSLGLEAHIVELEIKGYTVIPPEVACPKGLGDRLLEGCLQVAVRRHGVRPDLCAEGPYVPGGSELHEGALGAAEGDSPIGDMMHSLVLEGRVFEEALMNPVLLAVATYLVGYNSILLTMACFMKGPNKSPLPLHCDAMGVSPLQAIPTESNMTYALTDYARENGCVAFVPGSHKWCRQPQAHERNVIDNPRAVAIECPAGSLVCWHGNTWHGAFNRTAPGLRVSIVVDFVRRHIRSQENLTGLVPQEVIDRNPARFAILTHQAVPRTSTDPAVTAAEMERATKYLSAYHEELGVDLNGAAGSIYA